jgi:glucose 1-dehydrogenase
MKAVILDHTRREVNERDIPEPVLTSENQVLFRVCEIGICGTDRDLAAFRLVFPPGPNGYLVLGHECLGQVLRIGPGVTTVSPGDFVVPLVRRPCVPACSWCAMGRRDLCSTGKYTERGISGLHGYFTELAVDAESDLVIVPPALREHAVLIEPLSVVEKAVGNAFRLHLGHPQSALVIGAGPIGLLASLVLRLRGLNVTVSSLEPEGSTRARLVESTGAEYRIVPRTRYDVVIEAAGAVDATAKGAQLLAAGGVFVLLGATPPVEFPVLPLILGNQIICGSVNAAPGDFQLAVEDLGAMPRSVLESLIEREPFSAFRSTLTGPSRPTPKIVHTAG